MTPGRKIALIVAIIWVATALVIGAAFAFRGGGSGSDKVWCVGPGEVVDDAFKAEYPELYIDKDACDAING